MILLDFKKFRIEQALNNNKYYKMFMKLCIQSVLCYPRQSPGSQILKNRNISKTTKKSDWADLG